MKKTNSMVVKKGADALTLLHTSETRRKNFQSSTATVAEGLLTFPKKFEDIEIVVVPYTDRNGNSREYLAITCTDSKGDEQVIALSAFQEKEAIITLSDLKTITCNNICKLNESYEEMVRKIHSSNEKIFLHRVTGKRNGFRGVYEYFTITD